MHGLIHDLLKQKLSKEHLKANHNGIPVKVLTPEAETKIVKGTFESKSQPVMDDEGKGNAETKIVKGTFESKSQQFR